MFNKNLNWQYLWKFYFYRFLYCLYHNNVNKFENRINFSSCVLDTFLTWRTFLLCHILVSKSRSLTLTKVSKTFSVLDVALSYFLTFWMSRWCAFSRKISGTSSILGKVQYYFMFFYLWKMSHCFAEVPKP